MIVFVLPRIQFKTLENIPKRLPRAAPLLERLALDELATRRRLPAATYVFSGLELASQNAVELARVAADQLERQGIRVLNHPSRTLDRYELLKQLHQHEINTFRPYRVDEIEAGARPNFPVFIRHDRMHLGSLSDLVDDEVELLGGLDRLREAGFESEELLVIEYCDVRQTDGLYWRYGAHIFGSRVVAQRVIVDRHWVTKGFPKDLSVERDAALIDRIREAQEEWIFKNPHADQLRPVFRLAGIEYGRVDYGVKQGNLQIWEINTAPWYGPALEDRPASEVPLRRHWKQAIEEADRGLAEGFLSLDRAGGREVELDLEDPLRRAAWEAERDIWRKTVRRRRLRRVITTLKSIPVPDRMSRFRRDVGDTLRSWANRLR